MCAKSSSPDGSRRIFFANQPHWLICHCSESKRPHTISFCHFCFSFQFHSHFFSQTPFSLFRTTVETGRRNLETNIKTLNLLEPIMKLSMLSLHSDPMMGGIENISFNSPGGGTSSLLQTVPPPADLLLVTDR